MEIILIFVSALLFGLGLGVAGLLDPGRIQGFLDVAGDWNPGPLYVMASAMSIYAIGFRLAVKRARPAWAGAWHLPRTTGIDAKLVSGAALFGIGWGLSGYCPGPAIAGLALLNGRTAVVALAMVAGATMTRRLLR